MANGGVAVDSDEFGRSGLTIETVTIDAKVRLQIRERVGRDSHNRVRGFDLDAGGT